VYILYEKYRTSSMKKVPHIQYEKYRTFGHTVYIYGSG